MTIFNWISEILVSKKHWNDFTSDEQKKFSPFIINRWLSMDKEFLEIVNYFQKYSIGTLEPREVYKWYCDILPKGKRFNKYIKGKKNRAKEGQHTSLLFCWDTDSYRILVPENVTSIIPLNRVIRND